MNENAWNAAGLLIVPLIIHTGMSFLVQTLLNKCGADIPALSVAAADCLCIPVFVRMLRSDRALRPVQLKGTLSGKSKISFHVVCLPAGAACSFLGGWIMQHMGFYNAFSNAAQEELYSAPLWLQSVGLCIVVPIAEELLYRGLIFSRMQRFCAEWVAAVGTALLFAAGHGNMIQAVYAFPMALLLSGCVHYGGISSAVVLHVGANLWTVCFHQISRVLH